MTVGGEYYVVKETDKAIKEFAQETRKRRRKRVDSDLSEFLDEDDL